MYKVLQYIYTFKERYKLLLFSKSSWDAKCIPYFFAFKEGFRMQIVKRNNTWAYDMRIDDKRFRKTGFKTKKEAQAAANEKYIEILKSEEKKSAIAFSKYMYDWIEIYKKDYVSQQTYRHYIRIYEKVNAYFGEKEINKITREEYQKFLTRYIDTLSQDQLGRVHSLCNKVVEHAVYDGFLRKSFTFDAQVVSKKPHYKKEQDKYLNIHELKKIKHYFESKTEYLAPSTHIILMMIETGGRFSDCINLTKKDINKQKGELFLNGTKNDSAPRHVAVTDKLIKILLNYANNRPIPISGYLFTHNGEQITNTTVNKAVKQACKHLNIDRNITSHAFRHTHASYLIHEGINIYYISKRLVHSDISVTLNKYGHLLKESLEEENHRTIEKMENL